MEEKKNQNEPVVDQQYTETSDEVRTGKKDGKFGLGFYMLVGCVIFALVEIVISISYFF